MTEVILATQSAIDALSDRVDQITIGSIADIPGLSAALAALQSAATAATDAELAAAVATLTNAINAKQDSTTAATDAELAAAVSVINSSLALKQDANTAATDAELASAVSTINTAVSAKADASSTASALATKATLSTNSADAGKAIDAYTGSPIAISSGIPPWTANSVVGPYVARIAPAPDAGVLIVNGSTTRTTRATYDSTEIASWSKFGVNTDDLQTLIDANSNAIGLLQAQVTDAGRYTRRYGDGPPTPSIGNDGDDYWDLLNKRVYIGKGRTAAGAWPGTFFAFDTGDVTPPSQVTGVTTTLVSGQTAVDVAWAATTDNVAVAVYTIYRDGASIGSVNSPTTTFRDTTPSAGSTYVYSIRAFDASGNGSTMSATSSITVPVQSGAGGATTADDFNAATGTNLAGRQTPVGNRTWEVGSGGSYAIDTNVLKITSGNNIVARVDDGHADVRVKATITAGVGNSIPGGLAVRVLDDNNYYYARFGPGAGTKNWVITRRNNGSAGTTASSTIDAQNGDVVELEAKGTVITLYVNGVQACQMTGATIGPTTTKHGLYGHFGTGAGIRWDDFSITPVV